MNTITPKNFLAITTVVLSSVSFAQQDTVADPGHHKLEFENNCVRVVRVSFGPGEKAAAPFDAKSVVIVNLTGSDGLRLHFPDGNSIVTPSTKAGQVTWAQAARIQPENIGKSRNEFIVIEPKGCN